MKKALVGLMLVMSSAAFADSAEEIWKAKCKSCHGEDGKAQTKMGLKEKITDISTESWQKRHSDEKIRKVISDGSDENPKMKPYKNKLTAQEIDSLVAYVRTLKK